MTAGLADDASLCVRIVAVGAERGVFVALIHRCLMDAVMRGIILLGVAFLAGVRVFDFVFTNGFRFKIRVGVIADLSMAIYTGKTFFRMDRKIELGGVYRERQGFAAKRSFHAFFLVAGKAEITTGFIALGDGLKGWGGLNG